MLRTPPHLPSSQVRQLRRQLLTWFHGEQRDLPWRHSRDPYRIWVSEVMLQQTQVSTVIPYFQRFLEAFPTIAALAAADEQQVLRLWEGLGYYRRAQALHRTARLILSEHGGTLPEEAIALGSLPGIGRYTTGAILSQAFNQRLAAVDANVARVLCRWFAWKEDWRSTRSQAWLWETATRLLPTRRVGDWNQALMELGAMVCTPRSPGCENCPVRRHCAAQRQGLTAALPVRGPAPVTVAVHEVAIVLIRRGRALLLQRPTHAERWAGLWEFPHGACLPEESPRAAGVRLVRSLTGLESRLGARLPTIRHGVTRFAITLDGFLARPVSGRVRTDTHARGQWFKAGQIAQLPMPTPQRSLANAAFARVQQDAC